MKRPQGQPQRPERPQKPQASAQALVPTTASPATPAVSPSPSGLRHAFRSRSADTIFKSIMRGGGAPFGAPFALGIQSLTEKVVRLFKQRGFFGFETFETAEKKQQRRGGANKFTRYGASRYRGEYRRGRGL